MRVRIPIAATMAAVMAVGSLGINAASAAPAAPMPAVHQSAANDAQLIEVASKKKRHRGNNAAAAAAFAGIAGAMIGLAIQDSQRDRYHRRGYYYGDGGYYGRSGYYGGGYYGGGRRHHYNNGRTYQRAQPHPGYPNPRPDMGAGGNPGNYIGTPPIQNDGMSR